MNILNGWIGFFMPALAFIFFAILAFIIVYIMETIEEDK